MADQQYRSLWLIAEAERVIVPERMEQHMTVKTFRESLTGYPDDALCSGTFLLAEDFLALDSTLDEETIDAAMELAQESHDTNIGFNWAFLQATKEVTGLPLPQAPLHPAPSLRSAALLLRLSRCDICFRFSPCGRKTGVRNILSNLLHRDG